MAKDYRESTLEGANGIQLIVALYDGLIRFLHRAADYAELGRIHEQRVVVRRSLDILMYLQARLRPDVGGAPAAALADFYAAMFTMTLEASHIESSEGFDEVIACVTNVRDAWVIVAKDPEAGKVLSRELRTREETFVPVIAAAEAQSTAVRWSA